MTDKQIIIDYKNLCENYSKEVGCFGTFDGSCIKEQCFTYKLLQQLQAKEQECEELKDLAEHNGRVCNTRLDKIDELEHNNDDLLKQLDQLKAENEGFKILHKSDKGLITATGKMNYQLLQEYDKLKAENKRLEDLYDRVLETLKDIEIITQQGIDFFNETERHADWEKVAIFMKQQLSFILGEIEEG